MEVIAGVTVTLTAASLLHAISGLKSLALCLRMVSQAPHHFRSSEKQATCDGCFASQSVF